MRDIQITRVMNGWMLQHDGTLPGLVSPTYVFESAGSLIQFLTTELYGDTNEKQV